MRIYDAVRAIDELGRVSLPISVRKKCGWEIKDTLSISYGDNNAVVLQLSEKFSGPRCVFCGVAESAKVFMGKDVCGNCLDNIMN